MYIVTVSFTLVHFSQWCGRFKSSCIWCNVM